MMLLTLLGWPRALLARGASRSMAWGGARLDICTEGSPLSHSLHCHPYCLVFLGILIWYLAILVALGKCILILVDGVLVLKTGLLIAFDIFVG